MIARRELCEIGLSLMLSDDIRLATLPRFEAGQIQIEAVIFERLADTVTSPEAAEQLQTDYRRLFDMVTQDSHA